MSEIEVEVLASMLYEEWAEKDEGDHPAWDRTPDAVRDEWREGAMRIAREASGIDTDNEELKEEFARVKAKVIDPDQLVGHEVPPKKAIIERNARATLRGHDIIIPLGPRNGAANACLIALLALEDPRVDAILEACGFTVPDVDGNQVFPAPTDG